MKMTRCVAVVMALLVFAVLFGGVSRAAGEQAAGTDAASASPRTPAHTLPQDGSPRSERSRRMSEFRENLEALQNKWNALSAKEKASVYKLLAAKAKTEISLMNLYAKLGLISQEEAQAFAERVNSWLKTAQDEGGLPPIFGHPKRLRPEPVPESTS